MMRSTVTDDVDPREARLPKWAQDRMVVLRMRVAEAHEQLTKGSEGSRVFADPYGDHPRPLGRRGHVQYRVGDPSDDLDYIAVKLEDDERGVPVVQVYGSRSVDVQPSSSNTFSVRLRAR
jgi:hypothetical protein